MLARLLGLVLLFGCATTRGPVPVSPDSSSAEGALDQACQRKAAVTVHVVNESSFDIEISFGGYMSHRAVEGFSRTTYRVPRYYLENPIRLRIARGGLEVDQPPPVHPEPVYCNDATLVIGPRPSYSYFYGDLVEVPPREHGRDTLRKPAAECCLVTLRVRVPAGTGTVYLAGNLPALARQFFVDAGYRKFDLQI